MSIEALGLQPNATMEEVRLAYKQQAQQIHPDKGGTAEAFLKLREHYEAALLEASKPLTCDFCHGKGHTIMGVGFSPIKMTCAHCGGSGTYERGT